MILGVILMWIRVIYYLKYNDYLGKYFGIIRRILPEIIMYFSAYLLCIVAFAITGEMMFPDLDSYNSKGKAFKTLFYASFGNFDFDYISKAKIGEKYAMQFLVAYLII